jgi:UDPglucose 6-dehydrogenase
VVKVNDSRKRAMGRKVIEALGGMDEARGKKVAMLGLTFKPNTDDMRDSPSIAIAQALNDAGVQVAAYDPEGMELARPLMPGVDMQPNAYAAIEGADAVVIVTEWDAFRALDLDRVKGSPRPRCWWTCATSMIRRKCGPRALPIPAWAAFTGS